MSDLCELWLTYFEAAKVSCLIIDSIFALSNYVIARLLIACKCGRSVRIRASEHERHMALHVHHLIPFSRAM